MSYCFSEPLFFELALLGVSICAGILGSLMGMGAGIFIVPCLSLVFGVNVHAAISASLISVLATSTGAALAEGAETSPFLNLHLAVLLSLAASLGAVVGALSSLALHQSQLLGLYFFVLLVSIPLVAQGLPPEALVSRGSPPKNGSAAERLQLKGHYYDAVAGREVAYTVQRVNLGFLLMMFLGVLGGLLGIGCGALRIPVMDRVMRVPLKVSACTSNFMVGITSTAAVLTLLLRGHVFPLVAAPVGIGALTGGRLGGKLLTRVSNESLRRVMVMVLCGLVVELGVKVMQSL